MDPVTIAATAAAVIKSGVLDSLVFWKGKTRHLTEPQAREFAQRIAAAVVDELKLTYNESSINGEINKSFAKNMRSWIISISSARWGGLPVLCDNLARVVSGTLDWGLAHSLVDYMTWVGMSYDVNDPASYQKIITDDLSTVFQKVKVETGAILDTKKISITSPVVTPGGGITPVQQPEPEKKSIIAGITPDGIKYLSFAFFGLMVLYLLFISGRGIASPAAR
jgi:hypothetical protein